MVNRNAELLASALSIITNQTVVSHDEYLKNKSSGILFKNLDNDALHKSSLVGGLVSTDLNDLAVKPDFKIDNLMDADDEEDIPAPPNGMQIIVRVLTGKSIKFTRTDVLLVIIISWTRLTLHLVLRLRGGGAISYIIPEDALDPKFDFDFTSVRDTGLTFMRGNFQYRRPCGWNRIALQVTNKYEDNKWLGGVTHKFRYASEADEWPVSYHGTGTFNGKTMAQDAYEHSAGKNFPYSTGIYSTPDINVAVRYAEKFVHNGAEYRVVFQNRVNPATLSILSAADTNCGEFWISPRDTDVRPYGMCTKKS
ncbi:608_t:CDS:2 [Entrophospora sp. SA101]|nr:608_t:CDS:2 [Entrophospora sp. SA101]